MFTEEARCNSRRQCASKYSEEDNGEEEVHPIKYYKIRDMQAKTHMQKEIVLARKVA